MLNRALGMIPVFLLTILLYGCGIDQVRDAVAVDMEKDISTGITANDKLPVPAAVSSALIPSISLGSSQLPELKDEDRFDVTVNNVPAVQFFMSLVDGTKYNMVVHPEVSGNITLNLSDVTIPDVLQAVRDVYGYEFVNTGYGFQVLPGRLQARIYQINYLNIIRSGGSRTLVSSGSLTLLGTEDEQGNASRESVPAGTTISTDLPSTSFWQEIETSVTAIIGSGEGRGVVVNPQSGVVVVRALPNELREVERFLEATQLIVQRQVILEAKIIEVRLNDGFQTGINWSGLLESGANSITASNIGGGTVLVNESGVSDIAGFTGSLDPVDSGPVSGRVTRNPAIPIDGAVTSAFGGVFSLALNIGDFSSFIELLESQGNVQVLSSPRVATLNNQKAIIKVGVDEFFVTDVSSTNIASGNTTSVNPSVTLTPFFSGVALDVTPQISGDNNVTLHIHPSISDVVDQQKTVTIGTATQEIPLARSTVRETDSIVRAASGQVIVIGGLMQDIINDQNAGTPGFKDIPLLGNLFKHTKKASKKSELVILLKPIVVEDSKTWNADMQNSLEEIQRMNSTMKSRQSAEP
ncbi:MAG: pilus (MSHA type) biogenesis protein MshL [Gammaproteobacteria bacterium RIFCSPLOWO2_02_FULL_56_15]|nr:MAG: pilus (MSHA type) biogenesis protein MshL [Gammaproteobacteria bacterium RIFCSPLOWO2_02_FULL_56_15]